MTTCAVCPRPHDEGTTVEVPAVGGRVSVVVTHYEQHDDLARTLAALRHQTHAPHEVIVTDDGSAEAPRVPASVRLLTQPDDGFRASLARNRAAEVATGDVLVFLDADTTPEPTYVEALVAPLLDEPDLLLVGTRRFAAEGSLAGWDGAEPLRGAADHELEAPRWLADGWRDSDHLRDGDHGSFRYVTGATTACSAWWFDRVSAFDTSFGHYGGEDWEVAHRWWVSGGRLRHVPGAVAWHHGPDAASTPRTWERSGDTDQALAVASRVHAPPVAFRGLLPRVPRVVLTLDDGVDRADDRAAVVAVDGFLAEVPQATVLLGDRPAGRLLDDPRVRDGASPDLATAAVGVHVRSPLLGAGGAWRQVLADPPAADGPTTTTYADDAGPLVEVTDLRRLRRVHLGLEPERVDVVPPPPGLRRLGETTLSAWLGGWSDG